MTAEVQIIDGRVIGHEAGTSSDSTIVAAVDSTVLGVARGGVEPPTFRFSGGRSYQLSYLAARLVALAVLTGLEPATSALTGRRALQLLHRTLPRVVSLR
jgi:hypothetical protein